MLNELGAVAELFGHAGFLAGLAAGALLLGLFFVVSRGVRHPTGWAVAAAIATVLVIATQFRVDVQVLLGIGSVVLAGGLVDLVTTDRPSGASVVASVLSWSVLAGAVFWFSAVSGSAAEAWYGLAYPLVVIAFGASLRHVGTSLNAEVAAPMALVTIAGVWVTVPETDMVRVLLGVALPVSLLSLPPIRSRTGTAGAFALAGVIAWLTLSGGETRPLSVLGGWASVGVFAVLPVMSLLGYRQSSRALTLGAHVTYVVVITRVVDYWNSVPIAVVAIAILWVLAALLLVSTPATQRPGHHDSSDTGPSHRGAS